MTATVAQAPVKTTDPGLPDPSLLTAVLATLPPSEVLYSIASQSGDPWGYQLAGDVRTVEDALFWMTSHGVAAVLEASGGDPWG